MLVNIQKPSEEGLSQEIFEKTTTFGEKKEKKKCKNNKN